MVTMTYGEAAKNALHEEMQRDPTVWALGEDLRRGGVFGQYKGLPEIYGPDRISDAPISEAAIMGVAVGAALSGTRPVVEMRFADFALCAVDELVNQAAKARYMFGGQTRVPLVVREPIGMWRSSAAQHSQSLEAWYAHIPGLVVAVPSTPADNRALAQLRLFELFDIAYSNPFEESRIERVEIELDVRFERDIARIVEARVADDEVDPGSDVDVTIVYEQYGRGLTERTVQVHVPTSAAGQTVELKVQGGGSVSIEQPTPRNTADLIRSVSSAYPTTSIVTSLELPSRGLRFRGHVVTSLPRSALNSLQRVTRESEGRPFATYLRRPIDVGHVVVGSAEIDLRVRETPRGR